VVIDHAVQTYSLIYYRKSLEALKHLRSLAKALDLPDDPLTYSIQQAEANMQIHRVYQVQDSIDLAVTTIESFLNAGSVAQDAYLMAAKVFAANDFLPKGSFPDSFPESPTPKTLRDWIPLIEAAKSNLGIHLVAVQRKELAQKLNQLKESPLPPYQTALALREIVEQVRALVEQNKDMLALAESATLLRSAVKSLDEQKFISGRVNEASRV
jgi:hypothetical protein